METVYFWPELSKCLLEVRRVLKPGGQFVVMVEVLDNDSKWTDIVEGMTAYPPEQLKKMLEESFFPTFGVHYIPPYLLPSKKINQASPLN